MVVLANHYDDMDVELGRQVAIDRPSDFKPITSRIGWIFLKKTFAMKDIDVVQR